MNNTTEVNALARSYSKLAFIAKLIEDRLKSISLQLRSHLSTKVYNGIAITPGVESCRPSWKDEWKALCVELGKDPVIEEEIIKLRVGKKASESKLVIDTFFSPDDENKDELIHFVDEI